MPEKPMNAMAMNPAIIKVIPGPSSPGGTLAFFSFWRIPAIAMMAMKPADATTQAKKEGGKESVLTDDHE